MSFLTPLYLAGALLIALPIVLHLLRRDVAPEVPFTAVRLLRGAPADRARNRRLRDLLLLAARIAALLLLAASFARPYRPGGAVTSRLTVVAVDRSFSMGAPGRFDRARTLARDAVAQAGSGRVAVIAFDDRAEVVANPGLPADARAAIDALAPGAGATRYATLFDKVAEVAAGERDAQLVLVTDLQESGFAGTQVSLPEGIDLAVRDAGDDRPNLAIADLRVLPAQVVVNVRNFGSTPARADVRLSAEGTETRSVTVTVPPNDARDVPFAGAAAGALHATVTDQAGYPADNERFALASPRTMPEILLVSGPPGSTSGFYLSRALQASSGADSDFDVKTLTGQAFAAMPAALVARAAAVVLLSTHGLDRRAREGLHALFAAGGGLLVAAAPDVDLAVVSTLVDWTPPATASDRDDVGVLAINDVRHPIFQPFDGVGANLAQVRFRHAWSVDPGSPWRVLASFSGGSAALLERQAGEGRILLFTSDLDRRWNDFPLHASFVPFVQEAARYLGARPAAPAALTVADVPAGQPRVPGVVSGPATRRVINVDARESSVTRVPVPEFLRRVSRSAARTTVADERRARQAEAGQGLWRYGLALMLATLIAEAFVGSR